MPDNSTTLEMPIDDVNALDAVVRALGIEDSDTTPAEAVAGLHAEIERLRVAASELVRLHRIERAARAYYRGYCQDEAHDRMSCVHDQHHRDAQELRHALGESL